MSDNGDVLLRVENLVKYFPIYKTSFGIFKSQAGSVRAVDDVSFFIKRGETLGLVGESGCGKSTTGRTILQLYRPTSGSVYFDGEDLVTMKGESLRKKRRQMQMIFQDPYASLNPRMNVQEIVGEPMIVHNLAHGAEIRERVKQLLSLVGLNSAMIDRYPTSFRVGSANASGWPEPWHWSHP